MMKVRLFIEGQSKRPGICREAKAMYLMSYARQNGEEVTRHGSVSIEDATITRAALLALKTALERFTVPTEICLYIGDDIVHNAISKEWLQSWKKSGWKKSYGEIAHLDLWISVEEASEAENQAGEIDNSDVEDPIDIDFPGDDAQLSLF